ncbi:hypothetical protein QBC38DRAFT_505257 [Podospora fimiseda]|uniref:DUF7143 domain-containing protein n=1 Tax=Podospora fimiseda TaxID=252190 RepID=A0AAN7BEN4_9PEZI|nr:hypothetical protein QBC38DRAFT_505257 [Podospora fimiseda]
MKFFSLLAFGAGLAFSAPISSPSNELVARQNPSACFLVGTTPLPASVITSVNQISPRITCNTNRRTLSDVPDVTSGGISFSSINFATSGQTPLAFALSRFATPTPLRNANLAVFQRQLDVYLATEAGIRAAGGNFAAIKIPKFFLEMQVSRILTAQGRPPREAGLQIDHLRDKVLKNAPRENRALLDQVSALARIRA